MGYFDLDNSKIIGQPIRLVMMNDEADKITFYCGDLEISYNVEGECCSTSWIEHLSVPPNISGATVLEVINSEPVDPTPQQENEARGRWGYVDVLAVYQTIFRTTKGDIVLEYRNDSNGYYGGYLTGPFVKKIEGYRGRLS